MKVCITSQGDNLDALVDPRFGRALFFVIYDTETKKHTIINNNNLSSAHGVGIQSGQLMVDNNVDMVLTGQVGPKAFNVLSSANIKIKEGVSGKVIDVINNL